MLLIRRFIPSLLLLGGLSGCTVTDGSYYWFDEESSAEAQGSSSIEPQSLSLQEQYALESGQAVAPSMATYRPDSRDMQMRESSSETAIPAARNRMGTLFESERTHKTLKDYAEQLAMQLMDRAVGLGPNALVGVTSFVDLDSQLTNTNPVGNQLAEYFIGEVQHFGVGVVDFKVAEELQVGARGDFVFSREASDLATELAMDHVLTGTLIYRSQGISVNARIVSLEDRRVVASANVMIPDFVVADLNPYLSQR